MDLPENVELHPNALKDADSACRWYRQFSPNLADRLRDEIEAAAIKISEHPQRWPEYSRRTRYVQLRRFPFLVIFETTASFAHIVAIAHVKRRPYYWRRRLKFPNR